MALIDNEIPMFAGFIQKINRHEMKDKRVLVITREHIINFNTSMFGNIKHKIARKIEIKSLDGVTIMQNKKGEEFTIHVIGQFGYDMRAFCSAERREQIISLLKYLYLQQTGSEMAIYGITGFKDLRAFTTTRKQLKSGISNHPKDCNQHCHLISGKHAPISNEVCQNLTHIATQDSDFDEEGKEHANSAETEMMGH